MSQFIDSEIGARVKTVVNMSFDFFINFVNKAEPFLLLEIRISTI